MNKLKAGLAASAVALIFSIVMILLFPRQTNATAGTIFAVLFWLALIALIVQAVLIVKRRRDNRHG